MSAPDLLATNARVLALLATVPGLTVLDSSVTNDSGDEVDVPVDVNGRVKHYVVLYDGPGTGRAEALDGQVTAADYDFQVTCVGADANECRWVIRAVRDAVSGQPVDPDPAAPAGLFIETAGTRPPIGPDRDARPPRWFGVLLYEALVI